MSDADDLDLRAAEYALGLLDADDLAAADAEYARDPTFAALVEDWRERLAPMLDGPEAAPPAELWRRISNAIPANDTAPAARDTGWRTIALGSMAVAASLLVALLVRPPAPAPVAAPIAQAAMPPLVAVLGGTAEPARLTVSVDPAAHTLLVTPVMLAGAGRAAELWVIPEDGKPRSLGVIDAGGATRLTVAAANRVHVHAGATMAISLEPVGGSPTGAPTGPVVASGKIDTV